jgi:hypothetical protein
MTLDGERMLLTSIGLRSGAERFSIFFIKSK